MRYAEAVDGMYCSKRAKTLTARGTVEGAARKERLLRLAKKDVWDYDKKKKKDCTDEDLGVY